MRRARIAAACMLLLTSCAGPAAISGPIVPDDPAPAAHHHAHPPAPAKLRELDDDFARMRDAVTGRQPESQQP